MGRKKSISATQAGSQSVHQPENLYADEIARELPAASVWRLLAAWLYDGLLLFSILLVTSAIYILPQQLLIPVDASKPENLSTSQFSGPLFYSTVFIISYFFFAWFWTHGGQTLGLKAWSLRVQTLQGISLNWSQALLRFLAAAAPWAFALFLYAQIEKAGILTSPGKYFILLIGFSGLLWAIIDKKGRTFQDIFSDSRVIRLPKRKK
jgi:uncharacterized RDD family membrane protein YckC